LKAEDLDKCTPRTRAQPHLQWSIERRSRTGLRVPQALATHLQWSIERYPYRKHIPRRVAPRISNGVLKVVHSYPPEEPDRFTDGISNGVLKEKLGEDLADSAYWYLASPMEY